MVASWGEIKKMKEETVGNYLDIDEINQTLKVLYERRDNGEDAPSAMKINPKKDENEEQAKDDGEDINMVIYEM